MKKKREKGIGGSSLREVRDAISAHKGFVIRLPYDNVGHFLGSFFRALQGCAHLYCSVRSEHGNFSGDLVI